MQRQSVNLLAPQSAMVLALRAIVLETMANSPSRPYSGDSFLPEYMIENAQAALAMLGQDIKPVGVAAVCAGCQE